MNLASVDGLFLMKSLLLKAILLVIGLQLLAGCDGSSAPNNYHLAAIAYSPEHNLLFVAAPTSGTINVLRMPRDASNGAPRFITRLTDVRRGRVLRLALDRPRDRLWVADVNAVFVYELKHLTLVKTVELQAAAYYERFSDLALDRMGNAYVLARGGARIYRIDAERSTLEKWLEVSASATDRAVILANRALKSDDDRYLFIVTPENGSALRIDLTSKDVRPVILSESIDLTCGLLFWSDEGFSPSGMQQGAKSRITALDCFDKWAAQIDVSGGDLASSVTLEGQPIQRRAWSGTKFPADR